MHEPQYRLIEKYFSWYRWRGMHSATILPFAIFNVANNVVVPFIIMG